MVLNFGVHNVVVSSNSIYMAIGFLVVHPRRSASAIGLPKFCCPTLVLCMFTFSVCNVLAIIFSLTISYLWNRASDIICVVTVRL